jgi:uncharacterized membrane protein YdjX (TVP38/TMEM64 family)
LLRLLVIVVPASVVAAGLILAPEQLTSRLQRFLKWVDGLGDCGPVVLAAFYVPACLLFIPGSLVTLGAGALFGVVRGTIAVSVGSTLGASAAFWAGRTLARGLIEDKVAHNPKFRAIDQAVAAEGFKIVLLTRLSPVFPFNLLNYAFGLTKVRFRDYLLASWIGMLPGTVMYVYLGSAVKDLADLATGHVEGGPARKALFFVGLAATVVVTVYVTRVAKRSLQKAVPPEGNPQEKVP